MRTNPQKYIMGTRGSLLALTQARETKEHLEQLTRDSFELKIVKTEGDLQQERPLSQMEGRDFFTKELDQALLTGEVDLVVHSCKDLAGERPSTIALAAIPKRSYAADILLTKKETVKGLPHKENFVVGTSAPRRQVQIEASLRDFLPWGQGLKIQTKTLRGNVTTRLEKLQRGEQEAIVLALPGLERLASRKDSRKILQNLCQNLTFMILPPSHFPPAAAQGALAIECLKNRPDDGELLEKLRQVGHLPTTEEVGRERKDFQSYGGGCHLAVGVHAQFIGEALYTIHRGKINEQSVSKVAYLKERPSFKGGSVFIGLPAGREKISKIEIEVNDELVVKVPYQASLPQEPSHLLMASPYGMASLPPDQRENLHLWSSGSNTMKRLAREGYWVCGSADGRGENQWSSYLQSEFVKLMVGGALPPYVLTHPQASSTVGKVLGCYRREVTPPEKLAHRYRRQLENCEVFYWTSYPQYQTFCEVFPFIKNKRHASGPGKTYEALKKRNISVELFADMEDFRNWMEKNDK